MKADQICKRESQLKVQMAQLKHVSSSKTVCCSHYHMVKCEREMMKCENYKRIFDFAAKQSILMYCQCPHITCWYQWKLLELA